MSKAIKLCRNLWNWWEDNAPAILILLMIITLFAVVPCAYVCDEAKIKKQIVEYQNKVDSGEYTCYLDGKLLEPGSVDLMQYSCNVYEGKEAVYVIKPTLFTNCLTVYN